ncbi:MAG: DHH family phosphoesterase [Candidatus Thermoplasmatota archaeon]|nr:DHH family phosphoesterase [Candidatus Thermoplasmatota archaeon]
MYVIYSNNSDLEGFQEMVGVRGKESRVYKSSEAKDKELLDFARDRYRDIDALVFLDIEREELIFLSEKVKEIDSDIYQLAVLEEVKKDEKLESDLDDVVRKEEWVETFLFKKLEDYFSKRKTRELRRTVSSIRGDLSIFIHDDPDLDAIASAMALEKICENEEVEVKTYFAGSFGHPETEMFMENTDFIIEKIDEDSVNEILKNTSRIAFVDFAEASLSDTIPDGVDPDMIIDHHQTNKDVRAKQYTELRSDVGAASTLMTNHLLQLDIDIPPVLASALLVGIRIDTNDYTKNISPSDYKVIPYLNAVADKDILEVLENSPIYSETFSAMGRAICNREFKDGVMTSFCGDISHKDDIAEIANFLLRERDIHTVLICGIKDDKIQMSARSKDLQLNVGKIMAKAYSEVGEGGGHPHAGGGEVDLNEFTDVDNAVKEVKKRFYDEVF